MGIWIFGGRCFVKGNGRETMTKFTLNARLPALLVCTILAATPAFPARSAKTGAPVPDFSGLWGRNSVGFQAPSSGPGPVTSTTHSIFMVVGDYTNPILKPAAAAKVKKNGEISRSGTNFPTPSNQCGPKSPPYLLRSLEIQVLQAKDQVTIIYAHDYAFRKVRLNQPHPAHVTSSWGGNSVGHYEGDTLIVDTVGIKVGPLSMVDIFGTPQSEALHLIERYRLIDGEAAKAAAERGEKETGYIAPERGAPDIEAGGKGLQIQFTVEDASVFTKPWSASVTYRRAAGQWVEDICADNIHDYFTGRDTPVPTSDKPDF